MKPHRFTFYVALLGVAAVSVFYVSHNWAGRQEVAPAVAQGDRPAPPVRPPPPQPPPQPRLVTVPEGTYPWLSGIDPANLLVNRIAPPAGFARVPTQPGSFAAFLQCLPLKPGCPEVKLFNGQRAANQTAHCAVLDLDTGNKDLQQCADVYMRLLAEWQFSAGQAQQVKFVTSADQAIGFADWSRGLRQATIGGVFKWRPAAQADASHASFRRYLDLVFERCGTVSLARKSRPVEPAQMQIGDVFLVGGSPGHLVTIVDMAQNAAGRRVFLLAEGYMPAQDAHILVNAAEPGMSPWYPAELGPQVFLPQYTFKRTDLKRYVP